MAAPLQLTPEDGQRLTALFQTSGCLFAMADRLKKPLPDILAWAALPHIREALELIDRHRIAGLRFGAIETLRKAIDQTRDPVELRRAASAILRALSNPPRHGQRPALPSSSQPTRNSSECPSRAQAPRSSSPADRTSPAADASASQATTPGRHKPASPASPNPTPDTTRRRNERAERPPEFPRLSTSPNSTRRAAATLIARAGANTTQARHPP